MPIKVTKDGRTIRAGRDYSQLRRDLHFQQDARCVRCKRFTFLTAYIEQDNSFHVHHTNGRGMGGSKRDDTLEACEGLCGKCHRKEHHQ